MNNLDPYSFFFELPIYSKIKINDDNRAEFVKLIYFDGLIDAYNPSLKENTTYKFIVNPNSHTQIPFENWTKPGSYVLECKRTGERFLYYVYFNLEEGIFQKIGQFPSIADLHISQIRQYDKVLNKIKSNLRSSPELLVLQLMA